MYFSVQSDGGDVAGDATRRHALVGRGPDVFDAHKM
jgi:hypothetical protein